MVSGIQAFRIKGEQVNPYRDVREFHEATGLDVADTPQLDASLELMRLRMELHREEAGE